jgi:Calx-beta domain
MLKVAKSVCRKLSPPVALAVIAVMIGAWLPASVAGAATLPTLSVGDTKVVESPTGNAFAYFSVTLSAPQATDVAFGYATQDGTATAALDYSATSGVGIVPAGGTRAKIAVRIKSDINTDPNDANNQTFSLIISNPDGATLSRTTGTCVIMELPTVNIGDASVVEPLGGATNHLDKTKAFFTLTLTPPQQTTIVVGFATANGTGKAGEDYKPVPLSFVSFPAGTTSAKLGVIIKADASKDVGGEGNETFFVNIVSLPTGVYTAKGTGMGTIIEEDPPGPAALTAAPGVTSGTVSLSWTPPASDGGSPITDYLYQVSQNGGVTWGAPVDAGTALSATDSTCAVATCSYEVFAKNANGTGPASNVAVASPAQPPGSPALTAAPGVTSGTVGLSWTPPASDGGQPITDYTYEVSQDGGATWGAAVDAGTALSATDSTCTMPTCSYEVFATNIIGTGPASNVASASPPL